MGSPLKSLPDFSFRTRPALIDQLQGQVFDIAVIGGGITGAAVARDAALRGLKVALLEAGDFACGTSSGSTKLLHGGLRYLEMYDFKLVFEAIQEREKLKDLYAPLVHDLKFLFPTFKNREPSRWKPNLGLHLYDGFSFFRERHQNFNRTETLRQYSYLKDSQLSGACLYTDSFAEDYRLVVELIKSAHRSGACPLSRMKVAKILSSDNAHTIIAQDLLAPEASKEIQVKARFVFNCAGPFSDEVRSLLKLDRRLQLTQGVHFIVPKAKLPIENAVVCADPVLHRILFAIPWNSVTYIGTTDTGVRDAHEARPHREDVDYVLRIINTYFKQPLQIEDVIQSWTAVRPLLKPSEQKGNSQISREHVIEEAPDGIFHIMGGKLTSHRLMAEEALDKIKGRIAMQECSTGHRKLEPSPIVASPIESVEKEMALETMDYLRRRSSIFYENPTIDEAKRIHEIFVSQMKWSDSEASAVWQRTLSEYQRDQSGFR